MCPLQVRTQYEGSTIMNDLWMKEQIKKEGEVKLVVAWFYYQRTQYNNYKNMDDVFL